MPGEKTPGCNSLLMKYYKMSSPIKIKIDIYSVVTVIIQSVDFAVFILNVLSFHFPTPSRCSNGNSRVQESL